MNTIESSHNTALTSSAEELSKQEETGLFQIKASWSKAGIGTCIIVEQSLLAKKKLTLVFDLGCTPIFDQTIPSNHVLISHGHLDHIGGIFGHARAHNAAFNRSIPNYYVPEELASRLEKARKAMADLETPTRLSPSYQNNNEHQSDTKTSSITIPNVSHRENAVEMNIHPIKAGEEIEIQQLKVRNGQRFYIRAFHVDHCGMASLGFTIICRTSTTMLKEEYKGLKGKELGEMIKQGREVKEVKVEESVELTYTGDTCVDGLLQPSCSIEGDACFRNGVDRNLNQHDEMLSSRSVLFLQEAFSARLIFCEMTFLDAAERSLARERGHLCIADLLPILKNHGWYDNCSDKEAYQRSAAAALHRRRIVFYHISGRYGNASSIIERFRKELPHSLLQTAEVSISPFLSDRDACLKDYVKPNGCIQLLYK